jgi:hypothetical protein
MHRIPAGRTARKKLCYCTCAIIVTVFLLQIQLRVQPASSASLCVSPLCHCVTDMLQLLNTINIIICFKFSSYWCSYVSIYALFISINICFVLGVSLFLGLCFYSARGFRVLCFYLAAVPTRTFVPEIRVYVCRSARTSQCKKFA